MVNLQKGIIIFPCQSIVWQQRFHTFFLFRIFQGFLGTFGDVPRTCFSQNRPVGICVSLCLSLRASLSPRCWRFSRRSDKEALLYVVCMLLSLQLAKATDWLSRCFFPICSHLYPPSQANIHIQECRCGGMSLDQLEVNILYRWCYIQLHSWLY